MEYRPETPVAPRPPPSDRRSARRVARISAALLLVGGGLLVLAAFVDLGTATGPGYREAVRGPDTFEGGAFLAAGVGLMVAALVVWGPEVDRKSRIVGLAAVLGGLAVLWLAITGALAVGREAGRLGEGVDVALGPGLYLAMAGGGLALIGGAMALMGPRHRPASAPSAELQAGWGVPRVQEEAPNRIDDPWLLEPSVEDDRLDAREPDDEPRPPRGHET